MNEIAVLEGRIDALGQALLRVVAELEMRRLIDGPLVSQAWRHARPEQFALDEQRKASRHVLLQLAEMLDCARENR